MSEERPQLLQRLAVVACVGGPWHAVLSHCLVHALGATLNDMRFSVRSYRAVATRLPGAGR